jgi:autotransporter-associated beta strand protein
MKPKSVTRTLLSLMVLAASSELQAANFTWDPSQTPLTSSGGTGAWNLADTFWSNGATDVAWADTSGLLDTATFGGSAGTVTLGTNLGAKGLVFGTSGYTITGSTLTLGVSGIDASTLSSGTNTISSNLTLAAGQQSWNVGTGSTLALTTGTFTRSAGATLNLSGAGTVSSSMTGISNTNGIIGAWATVGTGASTRFATLSAGNLVGYTGATVMSTTASAWGGIPSGGTGTVNYDITISGTPGVTGLNRNVNTIRYTGTGMTQGGNTNSLLLNTNAILNVGTGTLSIGGAANQFSIAASSTTTNEMVLAAANANITINSTVVNNGANASSVTVTGPGTVTLVGNNTFTGNLVVNSGTLAAATGQASAPTSSNLGALQPAANRNIIVNSGGTLSLTGGNVLGTGGSTNTLSNTTLVVNAGGLFRSGLDGAGTGWWNKIGATNLNGGTIRIGSGANTTSFQGLALIGTVTVGGSSASSIENFAASNSASNGVHLGQNATAGQSITFNVADVTGNSATDLSVSTNLLNTSANLTASGLTKTGAGTMTLTGTNAYTGGTVISVGTLQLGAGGTAGSLSGSSAISNNANLVLNRSDSFAVANAMSGSGNLAKIGAGTATLSGALTHSGSTAISNGALAFTTSQSSIGSLAVADSAGLSVKAAAAGSTLLTTTSLTLGTSGTSNLTFDFSNLNTTAALISTGVFTANGTVNLVLSNAGVLGSGSHTLIDYTSFSGSGVFPSGTVTLSPRSSGVLANDLIGTALYLDVTNDTPKWTGIDNGNWQAGSTGASSNWKLVTGGTTTDFISADNVLFDDSALGTTSLSINAANVSPTTMVFDNTSLTYSVSGSSGIAGAGTLTKNGSGSLTLETSNSYSGGTTLNLGTLNVNNASALGSGTLTINGGTINNTSAAAIVSSTNNAQTWSGDVAFTGSNDLDLGTGAVTSTGSGNRTVTVSSGALTVGELKTAAGQGFVKQGAGTLVLTSTDAGSAASVVNGVLDVAAGTLQMNRSGALSAASGDLTAAGITGSGTITNGAAAVRWLFSNPASGTHTFSGTLANGPSAALGFNKSGAGTQVLSGSNSYTDLTTVAGGELVISGANSGAGTNVALSSGKLTLANAQALGTSALITMSGNNTATLAIATDGGDNVYAVNQGTTTNSAIISDRAAVGVGINHNLTTSATSPIGGGSISFTSGSNVTSGNGRVSFDVFNLGAGTVQTTLLNPTSANVTIGSVTKSLNAAAQTLDLGGTSADNQITGAITNGTATVGLAKSNSSVWTLSGASTYTGATTVSSGTLLVNGSLGNTAVTVSAVSGTARVGGNAVVGSGTASLTIGANGVLAPGNSPGTITVNGSTTLNSGSLIEYEYQGGGSNADLVDVNGTLTINSGALISLTDLFNSYNEGDKFTLFAYDTLVGTFDAYADGTTYTINGGEWLINYNDDTAGLNGGAGAGYITMTAIPEPSVALIGGLGLLVMLRRRRD